MDPFFKAKASFSGGGPRGGAIGYYEDLHTTYKGLPKRESALYRAAAERREIEKKGTQQIVTENEELQKNLADAYKMVEAQTVIMNELNSKLSNIDVSSKLSSDRGSKSVRIHEHEKPNRGESEAGDVRDPGDVRPSVLPDTHVDPAVVTNLRDDRTPWAAKKGALDCQECGMAKSTNSMGLKEVYETSKRVFYDEVINHPGVRLVAHAIE